MSKSQGVRDTGNTYQIRDKNNLLLGTVHETVLEARNHLEESLEDSVLSSLPASAGMSQGDKLSTLTHSAVNSSAGLSASSTSRRIPLVISMLTLHRA
jgi:hypothetical protein